MSLFRISSWIVITVFVIAVLIFQTLSSSFLRDGAWATSQEFELVVRTPSKGPGYPPIFAYWISGTGDENEKILRLLKAVYHPRNRYLLHLDAGSSTTEREKLALSVQSERIFRAFGNVDVVGKGYAVYRAGSSVVAATLHGAAVLLKINADWDWFITLSSSDYPLMTQDDLLHAFTSLPRDLNFVDHTSELGWKEHARFQKIVIDPSLHVGTNSPFFFATGERAIPDTFKLFTGSPWVILSRPFTEHCVHGWDNFPRQLLMYLTNVAYPMESYFQTVLCNSPEFQNTTVNCDLRYFVWDDPPELDPVFLNQTHYEGMMRCQSAFARRFMENDPVLDKVDKGVLRRSQKGVVPGKWCAGQIGRLKGRNIVEDPCLNWRDINVIEPGVHGKKLKSFVDELTSEERLRSNQCKSQ